jgi:hypothetical protein
MFSRFWHFSASLFCVLAGTALAAEEATDSRYPFRTDFANANLPWWQPKPLEFPPHHSDRRIGGELVSVDYVHRSGTFRETKSGELHDFVMPPYGTINYLNAEADLRDVPLGTFFLFFLNQDAQGNFTRLATMQDQYTMDAGHSFSYKLDEIKLGENKLELTKRSIPKNQPDLGKQELTVTPETRVWKGDQQIKLNDLAVGDELLFNITGKTATDRGRAQDIWVGADTHKLATENQWKRFNDFTMARGLAGWVDKTEGNQTTITFFGDPQNFKKTFMPGIVKEKVIALCVANDELRTWNPPVDKEAAHIVDIQQGPRDCYGSSGVRIVVTTTYMLEGFRKGHEVRAFLDGWKVKDQPYGESLMGYGYGRLLTTELPELTPKEYPVQFPFRTDWSNESLPWYQLKTGQEPPPFAEHRMLGELVSVDEATRTGVFKADRTGEIVNFALTPEAKVKCMSGEGKLPDIPLGSRCRFHMFQDEQGRFTKASLVSDEFSYLMTNYTTYRVEELLRNQGKIRAARQIPEVKNYNGDMERSPDLGHSELLVTLETRIWKGDQQVKLEDLKADDVLLVNVTADQPGKTSHCTDIWVGVDTHKAIQEREAKKMADAKKKKK